MLAKRIASQTFTGERRRIAQSLFMEKSTARNGHPLTGVVGRYRPMDGYLAQKRLHSAVPAARRAQAAPQFLALLIRLQLSTSSKLTRLCANGWHRNLLRTAF